MDTIMQFLETTFGPLVLIFTVFNLGAMGFQVRMPEVARALKNKKALILIFVWGWIIGPAFGYLITIVLPLEEPYVIVILLTSLAPCAPFLQQMVGKAKGDMGFTGALIPVVTIGTVILMPLIGPVLIKGLAIDTLALAKPLLFTIFLPLVIGAIIRHYADTFSTKIFPAVKLIAQLSTLLTIVWCLVLYGPSIVDTAGSFALLSLTLFMVGMALMSYYFRLWSETGTEKCYGTGYGYSKYCGSFGSSTCYSEC